VEDNKFMNIIEKNQKYQISAEKVLVGLGWKTNSEGENFDLDAFAFLLNSDNTIRDKKDFVYYNNLTDSSGALKHSGDNVSGGEDGDSEQITVELKKLPQETGHVSFVVTIDKALEKQITFGQVKDAYIRVINADNQDEIVRYNLGQEFFNSTSVVVGDLLKKDDKWFFDAVGVAFSGGIRALSNDFDLVLK